MRILLTGGDGFIGRRLREMYDEVDWVPYDIKRGLNVLDVDTLREHAAGCEVIVHLAAKINQVESCENPAYYYLHNIEGTRRVAQVAREMGSRLMFVSSAAACDWNANPYALSKWVGEHIVRMVPNHCILRLLNVYGLGDRPDTVIPTFINCVKTGTPITIYGDGEQVRDFIHVDDVCSVIRCRLTCYGGRDDIIGTGMGTRIIDLAGLVTDVVGHQVEIVYRPARQEIRRSVAERGIVGAITLEDGIRALAKVL